MNKKLKDLKPDPKNVNKHSEFGTTLLENSLRENGYGRSILISSDNVIIAGNGIAEGGGAIGMEKVKIIETDGKELVAVKRTDIKSGTPEFYKMAMADNVVAQKNIVFDMEAVEMVATEFPEVKTWAAIINPEPNENPGSTQDLVQWKAMLSPKQHLTVKKAMKAVKLKYKDQFQANENSEEQGNGLFFLCQEFLKNNK